MTTLGLGTIILALWQFLVLCMTEPIRTWAPLADGAAQSRRLTALSVPVSKSAEAVLAADRLVNVEFTSRV
ncbi:MAG: hypothetical protein U1G07_00245 [Verrucomicrobiota bacterium]